MNTETLSQIEQAIKAASEAILRLFAEEVMPAIA